VVSRNLKIVGAAMVLPLAVALAGCSESGDDPSSSPGDGGFDGTFTVYASLAVTGPLAGIAGANVEGLEAAVADVNDNGGILGREVKLVVGDDGADPTKAATLLQEQLDKGPIDFVVAGNTSNVGLAMLPLLTREGIISTGQQAAVNDPETYPYHFGFVIPNSTQTAAMVEKVEDEGYEKVAMLHANDANGTAVADTYRGLFDDAGIDFVDESFNPTDVDMTAQLQRLQAQDPDVLILSGLGSVAGYLLQSRTKLGWDIPTLGHTDLGTTDLSAVSGEADWNNVEVMTFWSMNPDAPRTAGFDKLMTALRDGGSKLDQGFSQYSAMWDPIHLAKYAFEKAGTDDVDKVAEVYQSLDVTADPDSDYTFLPYLAYTPTNHQLEVKPADSMVFIKPGPYVDGLVQSE
jgi:branched-chain amino acid transport system substrate-binding protein